MESFELDAWAPVYDIIAKSKWNRVGRLFDRATVLILERGKERERNREGGGGNGDRGRVCASIQRTKIRRWCSRKRKRTKIAEPWRNYFGASPIIWTTVRIAMIHGSAVTFVERDHFRGFRISAWVINAREGNIRLMWFVKLAELNGWMRYFLNFESIFFFLLEEEWWLGVVGWMVDIWWKCGWII